MKTFDAKEKLELLYCVNSLSCKSFYDALKLVKCQQKLLFSVSVLHNHLHRNFRLKLFGSDSRMINGLVDCDFCFAIGSGHPVFCWWWVQELECLRGRMTAS